MNSTFTKIDLIDPVELWDCNCQTILTLKCMTTSLVLTRVSWNHCFILKSLGQTRKMLLLKLPKRPPNTNFDAFVSKHCAIVEKLYREKKLCYIMGDFILNLLYHGNHLANGEFMIGLYSCTFFPLITLPSRITLHSATLR